MPMTELEHVESWSQRSRGRLRGSSLRLGLLDRLGLVARTLLVMALSSTVPSSVSTSLLTITLLLFEGWLIWATFYHAELIGVMRGSLFSLPLFPDQGYGMSNLGKVQLLDVIFLAHYLGDAIHGGRELHHKDHGLEVLRDLQTCSDYTGEMGHCFVNTKRGVLVVSHFGFNHSSEFKVGGDDFKFPI